MGPIWRSFGARRRKWRRRWSEIGHQPVLATSVEEGLRRLALQPFDLIISDYRMPNATGLITVCRNLGGAVGLAAACDFLVSGPAEHGCGGLVCLYGIESPGLTASLALAGHVAQRLAG